MYYGIGDVIALNPDVAGTHPKDFPPVLLVKRVENLRYFIGLTGEGHLVRVHYEMLYRYERRSWDAWRASYGRNVPQHPYAAAPDEEAEAAARGVC